MFFSLANDFSADLVQFRAKGVLAEEVPHGQIFFLNQEAKNGNHRAHFPDKARWPDSGGQRLLQNSAQNIENSAERNSKRVLHSRYFRFQIQRKKYFREFFRCNKISTQNAIKLVSITKKCQMLPPPGISFERFEFHPLCGQVQ